MTNRLMVMGIALCAAGGAARADKKCVIEAKEPPPFVVDVLPKDAARIGLHLRGQQVTLTQPTGDGPTKVHVRGALEFDAVAAHDKLPLHTARAVDAVNAMIHLAGDTGVVITRGVKGNQVEVDARVGFATLRGIVLPCSALALDAVEAPSIGGGNEEHEARFVAKGKTLHLRGFANRGSDVTVDLERPDAFDLRRVETEGAWWRVSHAWVDGTTVDGWVLGADLEPARGGALHDSGYEPPIPVTCTRDPKARNNEKLGQATIAPGTKVYAARDVGAWGTVRTTKPVTVRYLPRDEWMELVSVPGMASANECPEKSTVLEDAWVPRASVKLLDEAPKAP